MSDAEDGHGKLRVLRRYDQASPAKTEAELRAAKNKQSMLDCLDALRARVESGDVINLVPIYETESEINFKRPVPMEGIRLIGLFEAAKVITCRGLGQAE